MKIEFLREWYNNTLTVKLNPIVKPSFEDVLLKYNRASPLSLEEEKDPISVLTGIANSLAQDKATEAGLNKLT